MKSDSIASKLTWMNMLVSASALLLACTAFIGYDWLTFRQNAWRNLSIEAQIVGTNSVTALLFDDPQSATETLSALKASPNVLAARIYKPDGGVFAAYWRDFARANTPLPPMPDGENEIHKFDRGTVELEQRIVFEGKPTGIVFIQSDLNAIYQRLKRYMLICLVVFFASLLTALTASRLSRRAVARPIVELANVAKIVSRERNYSVRAPRGEARGELSLLIRAFNEMLSQIEQRDDALRKAHDQLEQRVQERTKQLATANNELEAFSYSVSHDLRAPLRSIDGFSLAVLEDYGDSLDSTGKDYLHRVREATQRMAVLIDDLLKLARVTRAEMQREPLNLTSLANAIAAELRQSHSGPPRQVEFIIEENMTAEGDPRLLRIALENLLGNCWKYTSRHERARIEFGRRQQKDRTTYFVRDDGAGFDPQHAARLFGAFQRLHGVAEFPGTGVGLATVQRIIHRHGGEIWAEGQIEKGATFYFTLAPAQQPNATLTEIDAPVCSTSPV